MHIKKRQDSSACLNEPKQVDSEQRSSQQQHHNIFRYQCPLGCFCVPDVVDLELLSINCRWDGLEARPFNDSFREMLPKP
uniref:Uncharacterized protein n=1 Tax=Ditylenchus dipsaci TaxID=166011 RepID=A0A915EB16_9BILA